MCGGGAVTQSPMVERDHHWAGEQLARLLLPKHRWRRPDISQGLRRARVAGERRGLSLCNYSKEVQWQIDVRPALQQFGAEFALAQRPGGQAFLDVGRKFTRTPSKGLLT